MILYILDIETMKKEIKKYFILTIVCLVFATIYEIFSHGVYSPYMMFSCLIPFIFGVLINLILKNSEDFRPSVISNDIYKTSLLTFTLGSIMKGVLEIYGTTSKFLIVYLIMGMILLIISLILYVFRVKE